MVCAQQTVVKPSSDLQADGSNGHGARQQPVQPSLLEGLLRQGHTLPPPCDLPSAEAPPDPLPCTPSLFLGARGDVAQSRERAREAREGGRSQRSLPAASGSPRSSQTRYDNEPVD